ncbi:hypothetical protein [Haladaptatus sp. YSMS36]|uniref:hypothetical protein n=1 Tax=Haladaptatus sp. YSMS36 TaxID=3033384 RepID=UPI0023E80E39|nr:hypothetical protein [Haladaptatus sp. YSMS36]
MDFHVLGVVFLVVLSGCGGLTGNDDSTEGEPTVFRGVDITNRDTTAYTVDVAILHNESVVYWTTRHINASSERVHNGTAIRPPGIDNTTRDYTVLIRLNNETEGVRYETKEYASDCFSIGAEIQDGELTGPVEHNWNDDYCSIPTLYSSNLTHLT